MDTPEATPEAHDPSPVPESAAPKRRKGGGNAARNSRAKLEKKIRELEKRLEHDPLAEKARGPAAAPGDAPAPGAESEPAAEAATPAVEDAPVLVDGETPPLGVEGAKALAPGYYGLINFATSMLIKKAPAYAGKQAEAERLAKAVALDPRGHYVGEVLTDASSDREAIDPALIPVLAKVRLTPEWALVVVTGGVLIAKYAVATGDPDAQALLGQLSPI